jgi:hemolysin activation/secretion protein
MHTMFWRESGRYQQGRWGSRQRVWLAALCLLTVVAADVNGQAVAAPQDAATQPAAASADAPVAAPPVGAAHPKNQMWYKVSGFKVNYFKPESAEQTPGSPDQTVPVESIMAAPIELSSIERGYVASGTVPGGARQTMTLATAPTGDYSLSAIESISTQLVTFLNGRGIIGVWVEAEDIDQSDDLRSSEEMSILIKVGVVDELRTLSEGERVDRDKRVNSTRTGIHNQQHGWILDRSPVKPGDLLQQKKLEEYIFRLSRQPGRRVDLAMSRAEEEPGVVVDYLVSENKPWVVYGQLSNTGTEQTSELRERFGFIHNQLTNVDDILSLDYITADFDDAHAVLGSYERPLDVDRLWRGRVFGSWSEYTASDVGFAGENFTGESWSGGGEVIYNIYQNRELFIDLIGGARWENIQVNNEVVQIEGEADLLIPHIGARVERITDIAASLANVTLEFALSDVGGADVDDLTRLGRFDPDENWTLLRWDASHSFFLEPLLDSRWADPTAPGSKLAHEIQLAFKGQYSFEHRLIPQFEQVVGGLYTVRGYPESVVAGDTVIIGTLEYRFHLPKVLPARGKPFQSKPNTLASKIFGQQFRFAPTNAYGGTDWDFILKAFVDAGQTMISDAFAFENDETLLGAGVGFELQFRRNLSVRVDWGFVLNELDSADVDQGDDRVHFVATFLF